MTAYYDRFGLSLRIFVGIRARLTSFTELAAKMPIAGRILDAGCGHGLFSATLALESPQREVWAFDHDHHRIAVAADAYASLSNLRFTTDSLETPPPSTFEAIAAIDVLHYLTHEDQRGFLEYAAANLPVGGVFLIREIDASPGLASLWNRFYEMLALSFGVTKSNAKTHYRTADQWSALFEEVGFEVESIERVGRLFADTVFRCIKRSSM